MPEHRSASATQSPLPTKSSSSIPPATNKARAEAASRNMTVETETVPSIAQASISIQDRSVSGRGDGSLRLKPSNETIRPKREKKASKRKAPSIHSGTASSKADVFEKKVAREVDEGDSSDSDATFIYESNPPEQPRRSHGGHHSRTPSMTSIASLIDPRLAMRDMQRIQDAHKYPAKKSSMKFPNPYNTNADMDANHGDGTTRIGSGRASGGSHHHHIGRHGQGRGTLNSLILDNSDSSMPQSSRARGPSSRHPSQPNSPRFHTFSIGNGSNNGNTHGNGHGNGNGNGIKKHGEYSTYDIDTENAADDERTPLISAMRNSPRVRTPRRRNSTTLRLERRHRRNGGWCRRFAGCLVLSILLLVLIFSAVGLVFATTKPLTHVKVRTIQSVIASQEEIMLDMVVEAANPNIIGVTIADMEVSIFAKSKHVGSDRWWRDHGRKHQNEEDWLPIKVDTDAIDSSATKGIDEGTDPDENPEVGEPRTMLLGRIFKFDSPLYFEGSFFNHRLEESLGEIRLSKPGNKTEAGGTERWEEVLQYPFELIVKGVFKYQLPLSTRDHTVLVNAAYFYDPDTEKKKLRLPQMQLAEKRNMLPQFVEIFTKPFGRFDLRGRPPPVLDS
ncbi:hypothetical protein K504DRAFT_218467 [Pleomassaria siparia CBS 279.74]|uniref:Phospholipid metabolism enzyme regulator n=1 Tax=Pleomassaria siparia CBS 279.74 TaxID=1314801 RepID=A0A6G1KEQ3_9PLEO|nr:hypothetical protein K504DRAFT_218467 [Pleomassaria siparia CBS 279.74]